jgi:Holliday junction resolvase RusA-like endonuclease
MAEQGERSLTVINLPFPPSTNGLFFNTGKSRARTQNYDSWIQAAGAEIMRQRPKKVSGPVILTFELQEGQDNRRRDVSNRIKAAEDLLVKHGIIEADHDLIVRKVTALWTSDVEGVRVTIEPLFSSVASAYSETSPQGQENERSRSNL